MIWAIALILGLVCFWVLFRPMPNTAATDHDELATYERSISELEKQIENAPDDKGLQARLVQMQRQMLATQSKPSDTSLSRNMRYGLIGFLTLAALGFYAMIGRPDFAEFEPVIVASETGTNELTLPELAERLEARLSEDPTNGTGWILYARALMTLRRFEEGLSAYDRAIGLDPDNANLINERDKAQAFAAGQPAGPTADQIAAAEAMSDADRQAMIENMVEGLAQRLYDNPEDPQGWIRLLKARKVLGQNELITRDLEIIGSTYSDRPEILSQILTSSE